MTKSNVVDDALSLHANVETPTALPQVLTRDTIPKLVITSLDAGDVLECYYLTRNTLLHGTAIQITKSALGLRYRHRPATGMKYDQRRLELAIEFGPARAGTTLLHESIPHVIEDQELDNELGPFTSSSVMWDNEGKVYYSEYIDSDTYSTANYLASVSGALLSKLLNSALDFVETSSNKYQRRRRYQPFSVYLASSAHSQPLTDSSNITQDVPLPKQLLKSSTDTDFLQHIFVSLAEMGVELKPVILPVVAEIRLHVVDMVKVQPGASVLPVMFYKKLFDCVKAIGSTDYSVYNVSKSISTNIPTPSPSLASKLPSPTLPSMIVRPPSYEKQQSGHGPVVATRSPSIKKRKLDHRLNVYDEANTNFPMEAPLVTTTNSSTAFPTILPTLLPTLSPQESANNMDMAKHQEQAANAAQQAQEAADAAGAADTEDKAVSAAQQAAAYAQKAASVTANQAALMARDAITSGIGNSVAQAVSLCFSDALYGIAAPSSSKPLNASSSIAGENISATTALSSPTVYLYWDGSFYYRMNLTAPYVTVVSQARPMPKPLAVGISREDFVDWSIAFFIAICAAVGFILLLQQVMGRNLKVIRPLYRFQRWFFQPTQFDWGLMVEESEASRAIVHGYNFGEDAIPLSMGGRKYENSTAGSEIFGSSVKNSSVISWPEDVDEADESDHMLGEMELTNRSRHRTPPLRTGGVGVSRSYEKISSFHSDFSDGDDDAEGSAARLFRDPAHVDLPNLSSSSKVAMPVSISMNE